MLERGKRSKRTERLRILEIELKKSLNAATAHQMSNAAAAAAADDDDDDDDECDQSDSAIDGQALLLPPPRPRIIISGFSNGSINGIYEELSEQGQGVYPVLRHIQDENLCLEWLNGEWWLNGAAAATRPLSPLDSDRYFRRVADQRRLLAGGTRLSSMCQCKCQYFCCGGQFEVAAERLVGVAARVSRRARGNGGFCWRCSFYC